MNVKTIIHSFVRVATGEAVTRLATFALFAYVSRRYGVATLGIVAIGQTVAQYVVESSDQGLKWIAVRLLATHPELSGYLVPAVSRRRAAFTAVAVLSGICYGLIGPIPEVARACVVAFVLAVIPYTLAMDWMAWGLGLFGVLASWRGGVSVVYVLIAIVEMRFTGRPVYSIASANAVAAATGALFLWILWRLRWRRSSDVVSPEIVRFAHGALRVSRVMTLGVSNLLNLIFLNVDILILGAMSTVDEVGRYSAACKPLYVVFTGFWLLTDVLYPHLAGANASLSARRNLLRWLALVALASAVLALILGLLAPQILTILYGSSMGAVGLFRVLLIAMPLDFCFSLLWTVLVSRSYDRPVLYVLGAAAITNVVLNCIFIPRFQAHAAAWATVVSCAILFAILLAFVLMKGVMSRNVHAVSIPPPHELAM